MATTKVSDNLLVTAPGGGGGAMTLLATASASASASVDFTSFINDTLYEEYEVHYIDVVPATDATDMWFRVSADNGSTFKSGASDYEWQAMQQTGASVSDLHPGNTQAQMGLVTSIGNAANEEASGVVRMFSPSASGFKTFIFEGSANGSGSRSIRIHGGGRYINAGAGGTYNAFQILMSSGNITSGEFKLYGIQKV